MSNDKDRFGCGADMDMIIKHTTLLENISVKQETQIKETERFITKQDELIQALAKYSEKIDKQENDMTNLKKTVEANSEAIKKIENEKTSLIALIAAVAVAGKEFVSSFLQTGGK